MNAPVCRQCGSPVSTGGGCLKCLLDTGITGADTSLADRIFQAALAVGESERAEFIGHAAAGDERLLEEVRLLLEGYAEAGGDTAEATMGGGTARTRWAVPRREEPGTVIDHFRLIRITGEGGMGSVWEAEQLAPIRRRVALKILKAGMDTEEVVRRFERERRTLARMTHPHIAQVYEAGATPAGRPYFAMELVNGVAITTHCAAQQTGAGERLALFLEVCEAVEHAHQKGVIHRDLKPSNILVAGGAVKVIDFGVAKATLEEGDGLLTQHQQILGTPAYMSPEQADSNGTDVDTRTDVYSLGVVLYELLSGVLPFDPRRLAGTHLREVQRILKEESPPRPSTRILQVPHGEVKSGSAVPEVRRSDISGDLDWIVMKALSKERARRYPSAAAFAEDVRRFLGGEAVSAVPPTLSYRFGKFVRRNKAAVAAVTAVMVALAAGMLVSLQQVQRTNRALAGEAKARAEAINTLADMYTRSGLVEAENGDVTRAALWFANAAIIGEQDPERRLANRRRAGAWRQDAMTAVSALDTGFPHIRHLIWNPRQPALMVQSEGGPESIQIWDVAMETRWPHDRSLTFAEWSPSGEWVAAMEPGGTLTILEYPSGKEMARLPAAGGGLIAWSPDSRWTAVGSVLWDWRANEIRRLPVPASRIRFSRDGRRMLLQWQSLAGICDTETPGQFLHPPVASCPGDAADFLGGGQRYAVSTEARELRVHDSAGGALLQSHPAPATAPQGGRLIAVSPDGRFAARENLPVMDLEKKTGLTFPVHRGAFKGMAFSPDSSRVASGGYDGRLELWSVTDGTFLGTVGHHHTAVVNVACSPDGRFVASGEDGLIRVWDTQLPQSVKNLAVPADISLPAVSSGGRMVAASGFTNWAVALTTTRAWHLPGGEPAGPEIAPGGTIMDAVFTRDDSLLVLAVSTTPDRRAGSGSETGGTGNIQFWNPLTGVRIGEPVPLPSEPRGICLHPSGDWLGVCCAGGGLEIALNTRDVRVLFKHQKAPSAGNTLNNGRCAYSPDGRILAAWGVHEFIHLWDRAAERDLIEPFQPSTNVFDLAFHDDTAAMAIMGMPMRLEFRSLHTGAESLPATAFTNWPFRTQFSGDGSLLLTAGGGRTAQIWDWRAGKLVCPMLPHDEAIMAGTFVPGTPWVITGGHDGNIKFWDRRTGMMIRPPLRHSGWVLDLKLTPDARTLIASGFFGGNIELIDLAALMPEAELPPDLLKLRAEIDADAEVHPGGGLAPLTPQGWLAKWREFQTRSPLKRKR